MSTLDPELLTMSRCRRLLEPLSLAARQRVVTYLASLAGDMAAPKPKNDPRQPLLPHTDAPESPFDAQ
jgi:hypothetical protein